jgi:hypothetical protein
MNPSGEVSSIDNTPSTHIFCIHIYMYMNWLCAFLFTNFLPYNEIIVLSLNVLKVCDFNIDLISVSLVWSLLLFDYLRNNEQLLVMDILGHVTMKNAAKCDM